MQRRYLDRSKRGFLGKGKNRPMDRILRLWFLSKTVHPGLDVSHLGDRQRRNHTPPVEVSISLVERKNDHSSAYRDPRSLQARSKMHNRPGNAQTFSFRGRQILFCLVQCSPPVSNMQEFYVLLLLQ